MPKRRWTNEQLINAVKISYSTRQVLEKLGLRPAGGNYAVLKQKYLELSIDISHFAGMGWYNTPEKMNKLHEKITIPLDKILVKNSTYLWTNDLRKRLLKENIKSYSCEICMRKVWNGKPIALQLHHIDGDRRNNEVSNLQILCPNCHAQTDTYCGKNRKITKMKIEADAENSGGRRSQPRIYTRKVDRPGLSVLLVDIKQLGYRGTGRKYGVSDNAVRKWIKFESQLPSSAPTARE